MDQDSQIGPGLAVHLSLPMARSLFHLSLRLRHLRRTCL